MKADVELFRALHLLGLCSPADVAAKKPRAELGASASFTRFEDEGWRLREGVLGTGRHHAALGDGVVTANEKEEVTVLDPTGERRTGWSPADATGRQLTDVMPLRDECTDEPVASVHVGPAERRTTILPKDAPLDSCADL